MRFWFTKRARPTLTLEEVLLEAHNLTVQQARRMEGRITRPVRKSAFFPVVILLCVIGGLTMARAGQLMVVDGQHYRELSEYNRLYHTRIPAERGTIYDRNGVLLAWNVPHDEGEFAPVYHKRAYAYATGTSHVLGYVRLPARDASGVFFREGIEGVAGVELAYDALLRGTDGVKIVETDASMGVVSAGWIERPVPGTSLRLSIDTRVQEALNGFIAGLAEQVSFEGGSGVIMDVRTGEILAMTNVPEYEPNALVTGDQQKISAYANDSRTPYLNRALSGQYTPGSIVKPFIAVAALSEGLVRPETTFLSTGALRLANPYTPGQYSVFTDWRAHGVVDLTRALAVSSNVYFYYVGGGFGGQEGLGIARIEEYMRRFGFGAPTGVGMVGEAHGVIPSPAWKERTFPEDPVWRIGNTYHTAIGQYGSLVTPLQAVRAVSALANGGLLLTPRIETERTAYGARTIVVEEEHIAVVRNGMREAVTNGTARGLNVSYVEVAGKTGTAEIGTGKDFVHSWAVGFYPYDSPRYAFAIMMEHGPRKNLIGGTYVMRQLLDWMRENTPEYVVF